MGGHTFRMCAPWCTCPLLTAAAVSLAHARSCPYAASRVGSTKSGRGERFVADVLLIETVSFPHFHREVTEWKLNVLLT